MSADYFIFDDFDSRNYGMWLRNAGNGRSRVLSAPKVNITDRPLGTSGEILFDQYYAPKDIPLEVFLVNSDLDGIDFSSFATYLSSLGQKKLILSYENYKYYLATFDNNLTATEYAQGLIFDTLNFKALSPFGLSTFTTGEIATNGLNYDYGFSYDSGLLYYEDMPPYSYTSIVSGATPTIYHGGNCNFASPIFKFTGAATTLKVEQFSDVALLNKIGEFNYGAFSGALNVDCSVRNVFKNGTMDNSTFTGNFLYLNGITTPTFYNRGVFGTISGGNVTLSTLASASNDYYNGMSIYSLNNTNCIMEKRTITDYTGATKVAILDSPFTTAQEGDSYAIHNPKDGMNYFKITGTGFSSLNLIVDFRYVYL